MRRYALPDDQWEYQGLWYKSGCGHAYRVCRTTLRIPVSPSRLWTQLRREQQDAAGRIVPNIRLAARKGRSGCPSRPPSERSALLFNEKTRSPPTPHPGRFPIAQADQPSLRSAGANARFRHLTGQHFARSETGCSALRPSHSTPRSRNTGNEPSGHANRQSVFAAPCARRQAI
jgi:hypothetical protein